jgi:hypothetical protein
MPLDVGAGEREDRGRIESATDRAASPENPRSR